MTSPHRLEGGIKCVLREDGPCYYDLQRAPCRKGESGWEAAGIIPDSSGRWGSCLLLWGFSLTPQSPHLFPQCPLGRAEFIALAKLEAQLETEIGTPESSLKYRILSLRKKSCNYMHSES